MIEQYRYELIGEVSLESTTPYVLAQASSVSNDAQETRFLLMEQLIPWLRIILMVKE